MFQGLVLVGMHPASFLSVPSHMAVCYVCYIPSWAIPCPYQFESSMIYLLFDKDIVYSQLWVCDVIEMVIVEAKREQRASVLGSLLH